MRRRAWCWFTRAPPALGKMRARHVSTSTLSQQGGGSQPRVYSATPSKKGPRTLPRAWHRARPLAAHESLRWLLLPFADSCTESPGKKSSVSLPPKAPVPSLGHPPGSSIPVKTPAASLGEDFCLHPARRVVRSRQVSRLLRQLVQRTCVRGVGAII